MKSPASSYPTHYGNFKQHERNGTVNQLGFKKPNDVYIFCNRFRLAKAFKRIDAPGYQAGTISSYSAILKVSLVFSAFEVFLKTIGTNHKGAMALCRDHIEEDSKIGIIRRIPNNQKFFHFVGTFLTGDDLKKQLGAFLQGEKTSLYTLARGVRHIFLHGVLTSTPTSIPTGQVVQICNILSESLLQVMDAEFTKRVP